MSNSCSCGNVPVPCNPDSIPALLNLLTDIQRETKATALCIKAKLFGEENCGDTCRPVDVSGYIGDLKRLARDSEEVLKMLQAIAGAL